MRGDRSTIRAIRGPVILITVGVLFALQNFNIYGFGQTWPVLLIVIGLLSLCGRATLRAAAGPGGAPFRLRPTTTGRRPRAATAPRRIREVLMRSRLGRDRRAPRPIPALRSG